MSGLVDDLLLACWPQGLPPRWDELLDRARCAERLGDYKLEPVFPLEGGSRPVRLAWSADGERDRWRDAVGRAWPSARLAPFLARAPARTRWMVDSDGSEQAQFYLDDLHRVAHDLEAQADLELMCVTLDLPSGRECQLTRHADPPLEHLADPLRAALEALLGEGAVGVWALRWSGGAVSRVAWISEARWRGNPASARRAARSLGHHPGYDRAIGALAHHGRVGYPDVVEIYLDGCVDLTLGVL